MNKTASGRENILNVLRLAPEFSERTMQTPEMLTKFGIWPEVKGWTEL